MKNTVCGKIRAMCGDCMEVMMGFPEGYFDLAIVDPPYGIGAPGMSMGTTGRGVSRAKKIRERRGEKCNASVWDSQAPGTEYFDELFRVSRNQIIWGGNYFPLPPARCMVVWDKEQALPSFSQVELAWTSFDLPSKIFRIAQAGFRRKDRTTAIIHPTQKPVELYRGLLATFAEPGFRILDTHGGSMTHAIACHDYGYELRIVERDEFYYREAVNRLKWYQRQQAIVF